MKRTFFVNNLTFLLITEMYEISPYATFSVNGGRQPTNQNSKTPTRGMTASSLDYTMQFKTFGHPESENLNATAYPILSNSGFGHVKSKSSWHKQRYYDDGWWIFCKDNRNTCL